MKKLSVIAAVTLLVAACRSVTITPAPAPAPSVVSAVAIWSAGHENVDIAVFAVLPATAPDYTAALNMGTNTFYSTNTIALSQTTAFWTNAANQIETDFVVTNPPSGLFFTYGKNLLGQVTTGNPQATNLTIAPQTTTVLSPQLGGTVQATR